MRSTQEYNGFALFLQACLSQSDRDTMKVRCIPSLELCVSREEISNIECNKSDISYGNYIQHP